MNPLVSILIPAYNAEKWLAYSIRSAEAQSWQHKEIIIIDDGSSDRTLQIARQFESASVRVFSQANQGAPSARNKAFAMSRGAWIQWLDADDLLAPDKIYRQLSTLNQGAGQRTLLSSAWGHFMYRPSRARFTPTALWRDLTPVDFLLRKLEEKVHMQTATWLVSRDLTEAAGPWDVSMVSDDDGEYFCRVLLASDGVRFVPEARVYYRSATTKSLSHVGRSNRKLNALWRSMQLHIRYLLSLEDTERARRASVAYLQHYLIDFYPSRPDVVQEMNRTAKELGGRLSAPRLAWKYSWIRPIFGWGLAQRAQLSLPNVKWSVLRLWDRVAFHLLGA